MQERNHFNPALAIYQHLNTHTIQQLKVPLLGGTGQKVGPRGDRAIEQGGWLRRGQITATYFKAPKIIKANKVRNVNTAA